MRCRKLDSNWDICFGRGVSDYFVDSTDNPDAIAQTIKTRLLLFYGEWWENITEGTPMFQQILGQRMREKGIVDKIIIERIQGLKLPSPDNRYAITRVENIYSTYNPINREYEFTAEIGTVYGNVIITNAQQGEL